MPGGRRGLVAPQNTFLENIIRRCSQQREYRTTTTTTTTTTPFNLVIIRQLRNGRGLLAILLLLPGENDFDVMIIALPRRFVRWPGQHNQQHSAQIKSTCFFFPPPPTYT
jgi:hypothetical protein